MRLKTPSRLARLLPLLALAAALAACDVSVGEGGFNVGMVSGRAQDQWTRSYTLAAGGRLEIINTNGRIVAEASEGPAVEVTAERVAKAASDEGARDLLTRIEMREEAGDARVRIETRGPSTRGFGGYEVTYTIKVPNGVHVDLRTVNGGVRLTGLQGEVRATTTNGGVVGRALRSQHVEGRVTNGGVDVELLTPLGAEGHVELGSTNGGVRLTLPADSRAAVSARAVNGGVTVDNLSLTIAGEQSRRRVEGTLNGGGARIELSTVNGGVRMTGTQGTPPV
ncbi:MAG: hypothetical protein Q8L86_02755 [Vicinamibacterales bacterium]|nr:hypothetical protein [Vicinamibacterales bacterium]